LPRAETSIKHVRRYLDVIFSYSLTATLIYGLMTTVPTVLRVRIASRTVEVGANKPRGQPRGPSSKPTSRPACNADTSIPMNEASQSSDDSAPLYSDSVTINSTPKECIKPKLPIDSYEIAREIENMFNRSAKRSTRRQLFRDSIIYRFCGRYPRECNSSDSGI
jgi:hypothetical protein